MSRVMKKRIPWNKGKHWEKEIKEKIGIGNKNKKLSKETKQKISKNNAKYWLGKKRIAFVGKGHPYWKGGKRIDERGYIRVWIGSNKWKYEHRLVMEKYLGRYLRPKEIVHHIDENVANNSLNNLMLFPNNVAHLKYHREDRCLTIAT